MVFSMAEQKTGGNDISILRIDHTVTHRTESTEEHFVEGELSCVGTTGWRREEVLVSKRVQQALNCKDVMSFLKQTRDDWLKSSSDKHG